MSSSAARRGAKQFAAANNPCDHTLHKPFERQLTPHGITIEKRGNVRTAHWRLFQERTEQVFTTGFDSDVQRVIDQFADKSVDELHAVMLPGGRYGGPRPGDRAPGFGEGPNVRTVALDQSKRCVVCGNAGGLPCPSMVKAGVTYGFAWFKGTTPLDLTTAHVHPGRCRKRLKAHNVAGIAAGAKK